MASQKPKLIKAVKGLVARRRVLELVASGLSQIEIAQQLGIAARTVRHHLSVALRTEGSFPSSLSPDAVSELRQRLAEELQPFQRSLNKARERAEQLLKSKNQEVALEAGKVIGSLGMSMAKVTGVISDLFGCKPPAQFVGMQMIKIEAFSNPKTMQIGFNTDEAWKEIMQPLDENDPSLRSMQIFEGDVNADRGEPPELPLLPEA